MMNNETKKRLARWSYERHALLYYGAWTHESHQTILLDLLDMHGKAVRSLARALEDYNARPNIR